MNIHFNSQRLDEALTLLEARLRLMEAHPLGLAVCGGAALLAMGLSRRTTHDVDIIALMTKHGELLDPDPLPDSLVMAAGEVQEVMGLPDEWLNNRPSRGDGGLFRMGLPAGLGTRLCIRHFGDLLTVGFIDRFDQIHLKLYAAVDRGGYHIADLVSLEPADSELEAAARWTMTQDVSDGFRKSLKQLLEKLGHEQVAERL